MEDLLLAVLPSAIPLLFIVSFLARKQRGAWVLLVLGILAVYTVIYILCKRCQLFG